MYHNTKMIKKVVRFFDKLEYKIRGKLSHYPIVYGFIGGIGIVLFWRGVWHIADDINVSSVVSIIIGSILLLVTGVFVSAFIGSKLIISGLSGGKKTSEKLEGEIEVEENQIKNLQNTVKEIEKKLEHLDMDVHNNGGAYRDSN